MLPQLARHYKYCLFHLPFLLDVYVFHFKNVLWVRLNQWYEISDSDKSVTNLLLIFKMTISYDISYVLVSKLFFIITYKFIAIYRKGRQASFALCALKPPV